VPKTPAEIVIRNIYLNEFPGWKNVFHVDLTEELAKQLDADGWNVTMMDGRYHLKVYKNAKNDNPLIAFGPRVDIILTPVRWTLGGRTGVKAYIQSIEKSK
jgi:hypothetical protein